MKKLHIRPSRSLQLVKVKSIEDEDDDNIVHVDLDLVTHHVSSNEHGEASAIRHNHDGRSNDAQGHSHQDVATNGDEQA